MNVYLGVLYKTHAFSVLEYKKRRFCFYFIPQVGPIIDLHTHNEYIRSTNHVSSFLFYFLSGAQWFIVCTLLFHLEEWGVCMQEFCKWTWCDLKLFLKLRNDDFLFRWNGLKWDYKLFMCVVCVCFLLLGFLS